MDQIAEDLADLELEDEAFQTAFIGPLPEVERRKKMEGIVHQLDDGKITWEQLDEQEKSSLEHHDDNNRARPTILHRMAENWANKDFRKLPLDERKKIALFLLDKRIRHDNRSDDPILTVAIGYHRIDFVEFIIANRPNLLQDLLVSTDVEGMNCLHKAFKHTMRDAWIAMVKQKKTEHLAKTMSIVTRLLEQANSASITAKDESGNTPIHYAMDYRLCHIPRAYEYDGKEYRYEHIVRLLLNRAEGGLDRVDVLFNNMGQSPYSYYVIAEDHIAEQQRRKAVAATSVPEFRALREEGTKKEIIDLKRPLAKQTARESAGRLPATEMPVQIAPYSKPGVSAPREALKLLKEPQKIGGLAVTPTSGAKEIELLEPRLATVIRRPTTSLNIERDEGQHKSVSEAKRLSKSPNSESSKIQSKAGKVSWPGEEEKEAARSILTFLKCFFIRNSTDRDAKDLLYGKVASDKNLFFDASHLRGRKVDDVVNLIEKVSLAGGFEDTLSYVKIPRLAFERQAPAMSQHRMNVANEKRQLNKGADDGAKGRNTLIKVFDELVRVKVRRILRLHVEDNGDEWAHTDTAIEQAIRGYSKFPSGQARQALEVSEWDWCKPDISLDVIDHTAPTVEHLHLHWSGSQSVLHGWASNEHGVPLLCRNTRSSLSKVTLHAYQGLESSARRDVAINQFCTLIEERTKGRVKVVPDLLSKSAVGSAIHEGEQDSLNGEQSEKPRSDAWIRAMEKFRKSLISLHRDGLLGEPPRVKVALIDDGVDLHDFNTYNNTALYSGVSYCCGSRGDENAWWKSTGGHGTIMANMISRINPFVKLDVIKIQSSPSYIHGEEGRSISPRSAADAINAAVMHGADIISMSWTITNLEYRLSLIIDNAPDEERDKKRADYSELRLLRTAISKAVKNNKRLLICSAADDIRLIGDNTLPYSEAPTQILRIGSAGPMANRDPGSGSAGSITYYLPGNQVAEEQRAHSSKPVVYHNGSSVSTALAAGLASLIMYCGHCLHSCGAGEEYLTRARALRHHNNMRKAFKNINTYLEWKDDDKIIPVWGIFGQKASQLDKATTGQDKIKILAELMTYLCHDVSHVPGVAE